MKRKYNKAPPAIAVRDEEPRPCADVALASSPAEDGSATSARLLLFLLGGAPLAHVTCGEKAFSSFLLAFYGIQISRQGRDF